MQTLTPVQANEREIFMDVLRGFAILGIFITNLGNGFSGEALHIKNGNRSEKLSEEKNTTLNK